MIVYFKAMQNVVYIRYTIISTTSVKLKILPNDVIMLYIYCKHNSINVL